MLVEFGKLQISLSVVRSGGWEDSSAPGQIFTLGEICETTLSHFGCRSMDAKEFSGLLNKFSKILGFLILTVRKMRGLQYIGAGLQCIGAPKFNFQDSGKEWRGRALIKPGFVYHMMVQLMDWKPFVCRVSC